MLKVEVIPNGLNDSACVFIVYKTFWIFKFEIGRVLSYEQLEKFFEMYEHYSGVTVCPK